MSIIASTVARQVGIRQRSLGRRCRLGRATELVFVLATGTVLLSGGGAEAQVWTGSTNSNWNVNGNWDTVVPAAAGAVIINSGAPNQPVLNVNSAALTSTTINGGTLEVDALLDSATITINTTGTLVIDSGSIVDTATVAVNGGTLEVTANDTIGTLSGTGGTIDIDNNRTLTVTQGSANTFGGVISGDGEFAKAGTGTLTLTGINTITDRITVSAGALNIQNNAALGTTGSNTVVSNGAALELQGGITVGETEIRISGTGVSNGGAIRNISGDNALTGTVILDANARINSDAGTLTLGAISNNVGPGPDPAKDLTLGGAGNIAVGGVITLGTGTLLKDGAGTATLTGVNTYTGSTTVNGGTLAITGTGSIVNSLAIGITSGTLTVDAGALNADAVVTNAGTFDVNSGTVQINRVSGAGTVNLDSGAILRVDNGTSAISGALSGSGTLDVFNAAATVTLTGDSTGFTGAVDVNAGTLNLGSLNAIGAAGTLNIDGGTANVTVANTNVGNLSGSAGSLVLGANTITLALPGTGSSTYAGAISGTGTVATATTATGTQILSGPLSMTNLDINGGTVTLSNAGNTISGTINVGNGTLRLTATGAQGTALIRTDGTAAAPASVIDIASGVTVSTGIELASTDAQINVTSGTATVSGVINQSIANAPLEKTGAGTLVLTGANTYSGTTTITGGVLQVGNGGTAGALGTGAIVNNATLTINRSDAVTLAGAISGTGQLRQNGTGTTILTGANTYSGVTTISAGTLQVGNGGTTGTLGTGAVTNNAALVFDRSDTVTLGSVISGTGTLRQAGTGTLILTANNTFSGGTTIEAGGTLQVGDGGTAGSLGTGNVTNDGTLVFNRSNALTVASVISGTGAVTKNGTGTTTLSGTNTYTGLTTVNAGTLTVTGQIAGNVVVDGSGRLRIGNSNAIGGTITTTGSTVSYANGVNEASALIISSANTDLEVLSGEAAEQSGVISSTGAFGFEKIGTGNLTVSGVNTYTGVTTVSAGTLTVASNAGLGATGAGNGTSVTAGATLALSGGITTAENITLNGNGVSSNGALRNVAGTNTVSGNLTLASASEIQTDAGTTLTVSGGVDLAGNLLTVQSAGTTTVSGIVSGAGGITKTGSGNLTLSGANTYTGVTTVSAGTLTAGSNGALGATGAGNETTVTSGATLALTGGITTAEAITLNGTGVGGNGALVNASGANTLSGQITLGSAATIANADTDFVDQLIITGGITGTNTNLTFAGNGSFDVSSAITTGTGTLTKNGSGVVFLQGVNTFTGATTINDGSINVNSGSALSDTALLTINAPGVLAVQTSETVGNIAGDGQVRLFAGATLTAGDATPTRTFSGTIVDNNPGDAGNFVKAGTGTLTLSGANTYTGTTTVNGGVLSVTGSLASLSNVVNSTGTLRVDGAALDDTSTVTLNGTGILNLTGSETIGALASASATSSVTLGGNTLTVNGDGDGTTNESTTFAGVISGTGGLTKSGTDILVLSGTNTYTGTTTVSGGELHLNGGTALVDTGAVNVTGGRLEINSSETIGSLAGAAPGIVDLNANTLTVNGDGDGTTTETTTFSGEITGAGNLVKSGTDVLVLSGTNTFTGDATVTGGTLRVTGGTALDDTVDVIVGAGGTFDVTGTEEIGSLATTPVGPTPIPTASVTIASGQALDIVGSSDTTFAGNVSGTGSLVNSGGGTLTLTGTNDLTGTLQAFGAGSEVALTGAGTVASLNIAAINGGTITTDGGAFAEPSAAVAIDGGGVLTITGSESISHVTDNAAGPTDGTININGAGTVLTLNGSANNSQIGGTVATTGGGTLTVALGTTTVAATGDVQVVTTIDSSAVVINDGTMAAVTNEGEFTANDGSNTGDLTNTGTADINASTTVTDVASITNNTGGTVTIDGGAAAGQAVDVAGAIDVNAGTVTTTGFVIAGSVTNAATFNAEGSLDAPVTNENGGIFNVTGALGGVGNIFANNAGATLNVVNGSYTGLGAITNNGTVNVTGQTLSGASHTNNALYIVTAGTIGGAFTNGAAGVVQVGTATSGGTSATFTGGLSGGTIDLETAAGNHTLNLSGGAGSVGATRYLLNYDEFGVGDVINSVGGNAIQDGAEQAFDVSVAGFGLNLGTEAVLVQGQAGLTTSLVVDQAFGTTIYTIIDDTVNDANGIRTLLVAESNPGIGGITSGVSLTQALIANVVNRPSSPFASGLAAEEGCSHGGYFRGVFGRSVASGTTFNTFTTRSTEITATYGGAQAGYDFGCNDGRFFNGWDGTFGALVGYNKGSSEQPVIFDTGSGAALTSITTTDFNQSYVGAYAVLSRARLTADVQLRFENNDYTLNEQVFLGEGLGVADTEFSADSVNLTGRVSYSFDLNDQGLTFVPTGGFSFTRTEGSTVVLNGADDAPGGVDDQILVIDPYNSKVAFIGGTIAKSRINEAGNAGTTLFVSGNYYREFGGDRTSTFDPTPSTPPGADIQTITATSIGGFGELSVGWNYLRILDNGPGGARQLNANVRADARFGSNVSNAYSITAQIRLSF